MDKYKKKSFGPRGGSGGGGRDFKGGGGGGRRDFKGGGGSRNSGRENPEREFHPAVCSDCGSKTQVPFKPTGDKPIRCSDCFGAMKERAGGDSRGGRDSYSKKPQSSYSKPQASANLAKIEKSLQAMEEVMKEALTLLRRATQESYSESATPSKKKSAKAPKPETLAAIMKDAMEE